VPILGNFYGEPGKQLVTVLGVLARRMETSPRQSGYRAGPTGQLFRKATRRPRWHSATQGKARRGIHAVSLALFAPSLALLIACTKLCLLCLAQPSVSTNLRSLSLGAPRSLVAQCSRKRFFSLWFARSGLSVAAGAPPFRALAPQLRRRRDSPRRTHCSLSSPVPLCTLFADYSRIRGTRSSRLAPCADQDHRCPYEIPCMAPRRRPGSSRVTLLAVLACSPQLSRAWPRLTWIRSSHVLNLPAQHE